jgi:hypothetical protein
MSTLTSPLPPLPARLSPHSTEQTDSLKPYMRLSPGSLVTIRMRGHSRTQGQEYFAPAFVLNQYHPNGEIDAVVFDTTSSVSFANAYPIRDLTVSGDGPSRRMTELQSNIGEVLFEPSHFRDQQYAVSELQMFVSNLVDSNNYLKERIKYLEELIVGSNKPSADPGPAAGPAGPAGPGPAAGPAGPAGPGPAAGPAGPAGPGPLKPEKK